SYIQDLTAASHRLQSPCSYGDNYACHVARLSRISAISISYDDNVRMNHGVVSVSPGNEAADCAVYQNQCATCLKGEDRAIRAGLRAAVTATAGFSPAA
ncbi:MAG: hypothetical protein OXI37_02365, partial [Gammaproteobacteria bacterium]|nr:hypothetical protein [Gammaproteobacteria bacterium]